jgi:hypothetical protein
MPEADAVELLMDQHEQIRGLWGSKTRFGL